MADNMLKTDYLIVGSGAVGMAFADILLSETDANIILTLCDYFDFQEKQRLIFYCKIIS